MVKLNTTLIFMNWCIPTACNVSTGRIFLLCLLKQCQGFPAAAQLPHSAGWLGMRWALGWGRAPAPCAKGKAQGSKGLKSWQNHKTSSDKDLESRWEKLVDHKDSYSLSLAVKKHCQHRKNCRCRECSSPHSFSAWSENTCGCTDND